MSSSGHLTTGTLRKAVLFLVLPLTVVPASRALASTQAPAIKLTPAVGPPTTITLVAGKGFGASERVDIRFDATPVGRTRTDTTGGFSASITVPASALPGAHTVSAKGKVSHLSATATFRIRTDWPQFHFDLHQTGFNPYENVLDPSNVPGLSLHWKAPVAPSNPVITASVSVVGGKVYVAGGETLSWTIYVSAFDEATGELLWQTPFQDAGSAQGVAVADGRVFVPTLLGHSLEALDAETGAPLWTYHALGGMSQPAVSDGIVYVGTNSNQFYAIDAVTGEQLWGVSAKGGILGAPAVANGIVYFGSEDKKLYAFDALTGYPKWQIGTNGEIISSPAVSGGVVYVGSYDHYLYAFDAFSGTPLWRAQTGASISSSPAVADGVVYTGTGFQEDLDPNLYAFDADTGALAWKSPLGGPVAQSVSTADGVVYAGSMDDSLYALDASNGDVLWSYATGNQLAESVAIVDGAVYTGSMDGYLYAFGL